MRISGGCTGDGGTYIVRCRYLLSLSLSVGIDDRGSEVPKLVRGGRAKAAEEWEWRKGGDGIAVPGGIGVGDSTGGRGGNVGTDPCVEVRLVADGDFLANLRRSESYMGYLQCM